MLICGPSKGRKHKKYRMTRGPVLEDVELSSLSSLSIDVTLKSGSLLVFINFPLCENTVSYQSVALDPCKAWAIVSQLMLLLGLPGQEALSSHPYCKQGHTLAFKKRLTFFSACLCVQNKLSILFLDLECSYFF